MDHLVVPLDPGHVEAIAELVDGLALAVGATPTPEAPEPHVTLVAFAGLRRSGAHAALRPITIATKPFTVHAHGFGFFAGSDPSALSLHVAVVRTHALNALHSRVCAALHGAGGDVAGWSEPQVWSPHITLLDRSLDADRLGQAAAWLARRHHPSWRIPVDRVALSGSWPDRDEPPDVIYFGSTGGAPAAVRDLRPYRSRTTSNTV